MLEIPEKLAEFAHKLLYNFDYFSDFMANGGLVGVISIPLIIYMVRIIVKDYRGNS